MMKRTHMSVAILVTLPLIISSPISIVGVIGSTIPDWDYRIGLEHRTITHSILALVVSTGIMYCVFTTATLVWFIAYLSHLILDSMTVHGIPFLYPFNKRCSRWSKIKTGKSEDLFIALLAFYVIISVFLRY